MMTKEELAAQLHGHQYGEEISPALAQEALHYGLVIVFGTSDDLMELRGAIDEEVGACDGASIIVTAEGLFPEDACEAQCQFYTQAKEDALAKGSIIEALWCQEGYSWTYDTDIPHATFDILEGEEQYCRGIVFLLVDARRG